MPTRSQRSDKKDLLQEHLSKLISTTSGGFESLLAEDESVFEGFGFDASGEPDQGRLAREGVERIARGEAPDDEQQDALEAIILPGLRPVIDIRDDTYEIGPAIRHFTHYAQQPLRGRIEAAIPSIGRIELPDHPQLPYGGTGFVVGDGLLMTNRHVANLFAQGVGREELRFRSGQSAMIDMKREVDRTDSLTFTITRVLMIHPYWDMALLAASGLSVEPLVLTSADPGDLVDREIAVIGYPALDTRNNVDRQNEIFRHRFNVKRLQPGLFRDSADVRSFGHMVTASTHDSSTLGGNSGSAVIDVQTGRVVALHFAGRYLEANFAVPARELARDGRVVDAGVKFDEAIPATTTSWDDYWVDADRITPPAATRKEGSQQDTAAIGTGLRAGQSATFTLPLTISISVGEPRESGRDRRTEAGDADPGALEALVEPFHEEDYSGRGGYQRKFLGIRLDLPEVTDKDLVSHLDNGKHVLKYEHFSVVMHRHRRLALFTASNVDARPDRKKPDAGRNYTRKGLSGLGGWDFEKWFTDPRIPAIHQLPDRFFTKDRGAFDKGHIVRRDDVAWGRGYDELRRANGDTYHVTNCSPQVADFNRSPGDWGRLEKHILNEAESRKLSIISGPVLDPDDRIFRGRDDDGHVRVQIPSRYWKIVVWRRSGRLRARAFMLEQDLSATDLEFAVGEWHPFSVAIPELASMLDGFVFPPALRDADEIDSDLDESVSGAEDLDLARIAPRRRIG